MNDDAKKSMSIWRRLLVGLLIAGGVVWNNTPLFVIGVFLGIYYIEEEKKSSER